MRDTVVSITFSSSENNCASSSSSSLPRGEKDERNETQRRANETKRKELFATARPTSSETSSRFYHPRPFRRRLRNDLRKKVLVYILLHHRSTSRSRRRTHSARARAFFSFFSYLRYKNEKRDRRAQTHDLSFVIRDRPDDAFGPISSLFELVLWSSSLDVEKPKKNP